MTLCTVISDPCLCIYTKYLLLVSVPANRTVFGAVPPSASLKATLGCSTSTAGAGVFSAAASAVSGVGDDGTCGAGWSGGGGALCTSGCWAPEVVRISNTEQSSDRYDMARGAGYTGRGRGRLLSPYLPQLIR